MTATARNAGKGGLDGDVRPIRFGARALQRRGRACHPQPFTATGGRAVGRHFVVEWSLRLLALRHLLGCSVSIRFSWAGNLPCAMAPGLKSPNARWEALFPRSAAIDGGGAKVCDNRQQHSMVSRLRMADQRQFFDE